MKLSLTRVNPAIFASALLFCALLGCKNANVNRISNTGNAGSTAGNHVSEVYMARDDNGEPGQRTDKFGPGDRTIHCVAKLKEGVDGTRIKFTWWVINATGAQNEKLRDIDYSTKEKENIVHSNLFLKKDWPPGKYKVEVYVNDSLDKTVNFAVE